MEKIRGNEKIVFNEELVSGLKALRVLVSQITSGILSTSNGSQEAFRNLHELSIGELSKLLEDPVY